MNDLIIGAITGAVIAIALIAWGGICGYRNQKRNKVKSGNGHSSPVNNPDLGLGTKVMLGAMGAKLLDDQIEKHKQESEKRRYESLYWQESIRDKNQKHDLDYDHEDDWLGN